MKSYPIWNTITACIYKSSKSYGVKDRGEVTINVGTSASNSHIFMHHATTHRKMDNGDRCYRFYIDGTIVKESWLRKGETELTVTIGMNDHLISTRAFPNIQEPST